MSSCIVRQAQPQHSPTGVMSPLIDVPVGLVNGARCKMVSLSWLPKVKHKVIDMLRRGTLRPKPDGGAYHVPPPYTINIEFTNRDGSATIVTPSMSQFSDITDRNRDSYCTGSVSREQSPSAGFTTVAPTSVIPVCFQAGIFATRDSIERSKRMGPGSTHRRGDN